MRRQGSLFLGLVLIGLGGIFLLRAMDVWPDDVSTWPGILIVIGVAMAADQLFQRSGFSWFGPVVLIGFGTFFLLQDFDVVESDFIWPALLIIAGVGLLAGTMRRRPIETKVINLPLDGASRAPGQNRSWRRGTACWALDCGEHDVVHGDRRWCRAAGESQR